MTSPRRVRNVATVLVLVELLLVCPTSPCGPGRGSGIRRGSKRMTPLVFKQHIPNVSETSLGASGPAEGRITRTEARFKELVVNSNQDILFKDADGTGDDRIMSQRCKEKLNMLSILVLNQWPGVKLRVTEGWVHDLSQIGTSGDSLHLEGRAVDITTSDRDRSKYGMLARLAVEAGFDWVYYESRGHVHCSVKSDSSIAIGSHGCFPRHATVTLEDGRSTTMNDLAIGDRVMTFDPASGRLEFDPVVTFLHRSEKAERGTVYWTVRTGRGYSLTLTSAHLIYVADSPDADWTSVDPVFADQVRVGRFLLITGGLGNETSVRPDRVVDVQATSSTVADDDGVFAPLTDRGTIVVDGVAVSCYAVFASHRLAHAATAPLRFVEMLRRLVVAPPSSSSSLHSGPSRTSDRVAVADGVHWYADGLRTLAGAVLPRGLWWRGLV